MATADDNKNISVLPTVGEMSVINHSFGDGPTRFTFYNFNSQTPDSVIIMLLRQQHSNRKHVVCCLDSSIVIERM